MIELETERLLLREWKADDLAHMVELRSNPLVMRHFPGVDSPEKITAYFPDMLKRQEETGLGFCPVFEKDTETFVGFCGIAQIRFEAEFAPAIEIGWSFLPGFWGNGYATEAAKAWLCYAFEEVCFEEILSFCVTENHKSEAVMRRLNMQREPSLDFDHPKVPEAYPHLKRHIVYRITRAMHFAET